MTGTNTSIHDGSSLRQELHEDSPYPEVTLAYLLLASLSMTLSNVLLLTILAYLNSLSLAKSVILEPVNIVVDFLHLVTTTF